MFSHTHIDIANRIDSLLLSELGQGIELQRMLHEPLYARDVLLVCDALRESGGPQLAEMFRSAPEPLLDQADEATADAGPVSSGFNPARIFNSIFGPTSSLEDPPPVRPAQDGTARNGVWFWRGRRGGPL